jgi:RNA polymerase sigma factor (sigma-70 family)
MSASFDETMSAIWRIESPKLIGRVARMIGDVGRAEEIAQDAFVAAITQWPSEGIPRQPGAWLMTAAKRRAVDALRRARTHEVKTEQLQREMSIQLATNDGIDPNEIDDDLLRLMFVAVHPVLSREARVALTLRLLGGLTVAQIAHAFLTSEATIAQRIVRAKRTLAQAQVAFEVPAPEERPQRLTSILEVTYLIFNEGYAPSGGSSVVRSELTQEAMRLGRVLAGLMPQEPEIHGLVALMELQASRLAARVGERGETILLLDQDRGRWDYLLIRHGLAALDCAVKLGRTLGPYALQASIAACHARARSADETDWNAIAALYDALAAVTPSPVVELNRAVAVGMAFGPLAGLEIVDRLTEEPTLRNYHLLPSVRADLLSKIGRFADARVEFERAAEMAGNERDRELLLKRAAACRINAGSLDVESGRRN